VTSAARFVSLVSLIPFVVTSHIPYLAAIVRMATSTTGSFVRLVDGVSHARMFRGNLPAAPRISRVATLSADGSLSRLASLVVSVTSSATAGRTWSSPIRRVPD
jgi:hypothetical protein